MDPKEATTPEPEVLGKLAKAYEYFKYDVAFIGREEAAILAKKGIKPDSGRKTSQEELLTAITTPDDHKVVFVRFPSLPKGVDIPSREMVRELSSLIKRERANADLLIGLTDWGWVGEREYYGQAPEYMPDLLFGSGHGNGVTGRLDAKRRCAWYRPYDKGRTVVEVQVNAWPDRTKPFEWKEPDSIKSISIGLGDKYTDNPDVSAILH